MNSLKTLLLLYTNYNKPPSIIVKNYKILFLKLIDFIVAKLS